MESERAYTIDTRALLIALLLCVSLALVMRVNAIIDTALTPAATPAPYIVYTQPLPTLIPLPTPSTPAAQPVRNQPSVDDHRICVFVVNCN